MKRLLLDTNVAVRFLLGESTPQGRAAAAVFAKCDRREMILVLEPLVLAEIIFHAQQVGGLLVALVFDERRQVEPVA